MWSQLLIAFALVLVVEGILPFISPRTYRDVVEQMARLPDRTMRFTGLGCMVVGVVILYVVRHSA